MKKFAAMLGTVVLLSAGAALAKGNSVSLKGVVNSASDNSLTLTTADKKEVTVTATDKTAVTLDGKRAMLSDAKAGERVVVQATKSKTGDLEAKAIKLSGNKPAARTPSKR
jgi:hypothetical protein